MLNVALPGQGCAQKGYGLHQLFVETFQSFHRDTKCEGCDCSVVVSEAAWKASHRQAESSCKRHLPASQACQQRLVRELG
jgi:hypothetical protein